MTITITIYLVIEIIIIIETTIIIMKEILVKCISVLIIMNLNNNYKLFIKNNFDLSQRAQNIDYNEKLRNAGEYLKDKKE